MPAPSPEGACLFEPDNHSNPLMADSPDAWDELIESIGPASILVVIESRMSIALKRRLAPEDIWQEALLHAWRDRHQYTHAGPKGFRSWLLTIIDHRIHEAVVRESARKRGGGIVETPVSNLAGNRDARSWSAHPPCPLSSTTPSRVAIYREQAEAMRTALKGLPEDLRAVVRSRLFEQRTLEQTAADLGVTLAAVRYRFARGIEAYREALHAHFASRSQSVAAASTTIPSADSST